MDISHVAQTRQRDDFAKVFHAPCEVQWVFCFNSERARLLNLNLEREMNIKCWIFGCPVVEELTCKEDEHCKRCGRFRIDSDGESYDFFVLDPIHTRIYESFSDLFFRIKSIVFPGKCKECGRRYRHDEKIEHIPY